MADISSHLKEERMFHPGKVFAGKARISAERYDELYRESVERPERFWAEQARENLEWIVNFSDSISYDRSVIGKEARPYLQYFRGGKLNVSANCLDRHVTSPRRHKAAIMWQGEDPRDRRTLTYFDLWREVNRFAAALQDLGVKRGTAVTLFMPMIPELAIAMLACARLGAIHSVVFSAFSTDSLRSRIADCHAEIVITTDVSRYGGRVTVLKSRVDAALLECPSVRKVVVFRRGHGEVDMMPGRDHWWADLVSAVPSSRFVDPEPMDSESPLFMLYTSGSTGKPKGVLHTTAGYLLQSHLTFQTVFDIREDDLYWCTADIGWITGHSYGVYGPLSNGASVLMYEGVPTYPSPARIWDIIDDYQVSILYTAPTLIRSLMAAGDKWLDASKRESLRLLGSVGEPINPEAWMWYYSQVGKERCPIVDTWWQTETGGIMITTLPGAVPMKPGSAGKPFFGVVPKVLRQDGTEAGPNEGGSLVITRPWPGMLRGVYGDATHDLVNKVYFSAFPDVYFTGDGCRVDEDGYHWLLGRIDDVINVSAHRLATAEIESALVSHESVAEAAVVGFPHDIKGQGIYCYVTLTAGITADEELRQTLVGHVRREISPIATPDVIHFTPNLPKTRSGKIMRRILRKIAEGLVSEVGDTSTLADPSVVDYLIKTRPLEQKVK